MNYFLLILLKRVSSEEKRIIYKVLTYTSLKDSSNIGMKDWIQMAADIEKHYFHYDGFVILHGTDTMAYTASALSFMMENLGKPVILTGAQVPISELRSDGRDNLLGAIYIAGHYCIPEVSLMYSFLPLNAIKPEMKNYLNERLTRKRKL